MPLYVVITFVSSMTWEGCLDPTDLGLGRYCHLSLIIRAFLCGPGHWTDPGNINDFSTHVGSLVTSHGYCYWHNAFKLPTPSNYSHFVNFSKLCWELSGPNIKRPCSLREGRHKSILFIKLEMTISWKMKDLGHFLLIKIFLRLNSRY